MLPDLNGAQIFSACVFNYFYEYCFGWRATPIVYVDDKVAYLYSAKVACISHLRS